MGGSQVQKAGGSVNSQVLCLSTCKRQGQPVDQKAQGAEPCGRVENTGRNPEASRLRQKKSQRSLEAMGCCRQKGSLWQRSGGSSCRSHQERGHPEEKRRAGPHSSRERARDHKAESTGAKAHWARDSWHPKVHVEDTRPHRRPPVMSLKRARPGNTPLAEPHSSPKRRRHHSPEGCPSRALSPLTRIRNRMGALEVALEELKAPGGAFLPGHSSGGARGGFSTQEDMVSQRAWLTWQLTHAGAALHWALHTANCILAAQAWMPRDT